MTNAQKSKGLQVLKEYKAISVVPVFAARHLE